MAQSLTDIFGENAVRNGGAITIQLTDFASTGLDNPTTCTASQALAAYLKWLDSNLPTFSTDSATIGVSQAQFKLEKSSVTRNSVPQIARTWSLITWENDPTTAFDPDNVLP